MTRLAVVSDVHNNIGALKAALAVMEGQVDELWCAGDIVLEYRCDSETVLFLRDRVTAAIQGNHDMVFLSPAGIAARERPGVEPEAVEWLASLPLQHETTLDGMRVLMTHGSPWEPYGNYLGPGNATWKRAPELDVDLVIVGHTHEPMVERHGDTIVVNPGSLGEPRQRDDRRSSFAIIDTVTGDVTIERVDA